MLRGVAILLPPSFLYVHHLYNFATFQLLLLKEEMNLNHMNHMNLI